MNDDKLYKALRAGLSGMDFPAARQREVLRIIKGETDMKPKKISLALVFALILTLLMAGAALAAALGVFGQLGNPYTSERMQKLEENSEFVNLQAVLSVPAYETASEPETVYDQLLRRQYGRTFDLTIHQTYSDGRKLYYSYTLRTNEAGHFQGEGRPSGIPEWLIEQPGKRYAEVWSNDLPGLDPKITEWLDGRESGWVAYESWGLGDGARLKDGRICEIIGSETQYVDEHTIQGYQEVMLPAGVSTEENLSIELSILYGTSLYYQDATGVYWTRIHTPANRGILRIPFTVGQTGRTRALSGHYQGEQYTADAEVFLSDVDVSGKVTLCCPTEWTEAKNNWHSSADYPIHYVLIADEKTMINLDASLHAPESGKLELTVRFDLPDKAQHLALRPVYVHSGEHPEEDLIIR